MLAGAEAPGRATHAPQVERYVLPGNLGWGLDVRLKTSPRLLHW